MELYLWGCRCEVLSWCWWCNWWDGRLVLTVAVVSVVSVGGGGAFLLGFASQYTLLSSPLIALSLSLPWLILYGIWGSVFAFSPTPSFPASPSLLPVCLCFVVSIRCFNSSCSASCSCWCLSDWRLELRGRSSPLFSAATGNNILRSNEWSDQIRRGQQHFNVPYWI